MNKNGTLSVSALSIKTSWIRIKLWKCKSLIKSLQLQFFQKIKGEIEKWQGEPRVKRRAAYASPNDRTSPAPALDQPQPLSSWPGSGADRQGPGWGRDLRGFFWRTPSRKLDHWKVLKRGAELALVYQESQAFLATFKSTSQYLHNCLEYCQWRFNYQPKLVVVSSKKPKAGAFKDLVITSQDGERVY